METSARGWVNAWRRRPQAGSWPGGDRGGRARALAVLCALLFPLPARAVELKLQPPAPVWLVDVDPRRGVQSALVQSIAVLNPGEGSVTLERLQVEVRAGEKVRQTHAFDPADLDAAGARMAKLEAAGLLKLYDFAFQTSRLVPAGTALSGSRTLAARSALVVTGLPLLVRGAADSLRLTVEGRAADGSPVTASRDVSLRAYEQKNAYRFPLAGAWFVAVGPSFSEPHRWAPSEEFALDVVRVGESGKTCRGACAKVADFYGYGQPVLAAADGEVVAVEAGQEEAEHRFRRPGESGDAFLSRTMAEQAKLLARGAPGVAGNYVVLRHSGGEFSHYAHLAAGSVRVKPGEKVTRGQEIGKLGHTGNSTEPHLHFTVADGPDPLWARSLPVRIEGLTTADGPQEPACPQSGWLVEAAAPAPPAR